MKRRLPLLLVVFAGCGGGSTAEPVSQSTTPERPSAQGKATPAPERPRPLATPQPRPGELEPTQADAERMRPLLAAWADALRAGDAEDAARAFTVPSLIANGPPVLLTKREQLVDFNATLPCGAKLLEVQRDGRYVVGTFRLTERPDNRCDGTGNLARVAFVIRGGRIAEWRRVPDVRGADPGPEQPEPAPKLGDDPDAQQI